MQELAGRVHDRLEAEPRGAVWLLNLMLAAACLAAATMLALAPARAPRSVPSGAARGPLASLPVASQAAVSAALGRHDPAYAISTAGSGMLARNSRQGLLAEILPGGVTVRAGSTVAGLSLRSVDWGSIRRPLAGARPQARGNVVTVGHAGVGESFTNGPLGLEQSFSVAAPPAGARSGALALELAVSGNRAVKVTEGGHGLSFAAAGGTGLRWSGLRAVDASGRQLASSLTLSGGRLLVRVDTRGASFPVTVDPFFQQGGKLNGSEESGAGEAGAGVAVSADGNTAIVGAPGDGGGVGAAFVFVRSGSNWEQQGPKLTATGESGEGAFGFGVALSGDGNKALIGAPLDSSGKGAAWVFTREGSTWTQASKLTGGSEESGNGEFGVHVALSADASTALVGASADNEHVGAAWVFGSSEGTWTQQGPKLTGAGEGGAGRFGFSVALSEAGATALVGGGSDNEGNGAAWVFTREGSTWKQQGGKLTGTGESGHGHLGFSAALSADGNTALVGAIADNMETGAAFVFVRSAGVWTQQGSKLTGAGESSRGFFGASVALSGDGNAAVVGGYADAHLVGAVWPFTRTKSTWTGQSKLTATEESGEGRVGWSVGLSGDGNTAFVGGPGDAAGTGAAWVFANVPGTVEFGNCLNSGTSSGPCSGKKFFKYKAGEPISVVVKYPVGKKFLLQNEATPANGIECEKMTGQGVAVNTGAGAFTEQSLVFEKCKGLGALAFCQLPVAGKNQKINGTEKIEGAIKAEPIGLEEIEVTPNGFDIACEEGAEVPAPEKHEKVFNLGTVTGSVIGHANPELGKGYLTEFEKAKGEMFAGEPSEQTGTSETKEGMKPEGKVYQG